MSNSSSSPGERPDSRATLAPGRLQRDLEDSEHGEATLGPHRLANASTIAKGLVDSNPHRETEKNSPVTDHSPNTTSDRFENVGELGRGGWGIVERAKDQTLDRDVAIKRIIGQMHDRDLQEQFLHEARITGQLQHPGIVPVHELGQETSGELFYVMKLLDGHTLRAHIREVHQQLRSQVNLTQHDLEHFIRPLLARFIDICNTIAYAHDQGVIHRDLKPANIMVGQFGETIVLDWGLAKNVVEVPPEDEDTLARGDAANSMSNRSRTRTGSKRRSECNGVVIGTPAYMSPEQARGEATKLDARSDIFSLGVILYEIVSGAHPHSGFTTDQVLERARLADYPAIRQQQPNTPRAIAAIVEHAMELSPENRYQSALELADDVQRWIAGEPVSVYEGNLTDRLGRWLRRHKTAAITISCSAAILLVTSSIYSIVINRAHRSERSARIAAEKANRLAFERLIEARNAADRWLIELSGMLEDYPGLHQERRQLILDAISHYSSLTQTVDHPLNETRDSPRLVLERAKCFLRLGDLHRLSHQSSLAVDHYRHADRLLNQIDIGRLANPNTQTSLDVRTVSLLDTQTAGTNTISVADQIRIEQANSVIGLLLSNHPVAVDRLNQTYRFLNSNLPFDTTLDSRLVDDVHTEAASAMVRLCLASAARQGCSQSDTNRHLASSVRWARWLYQQRQTLKDKHYLSIALTQIASVQERKREITAALQTWTELVEILEPRDEQRIDHPQSLQQCAHARIRRARLLSSQKRMEDAAREYRTAIAELNRAWQASDPNHRYRTNLATAEFNLATLMVGSEDQRDDAVSLLQRSAETYKELMLLHPSVDTLKRVAEANGCLADVTQSREERLGCTRIAINGYEILDDYERLGADDQLRLVSLCVRQANDLHGETECDERQQMIQKVRERVRLVPDDQLPDRIKLQVAELLQDSERSASPIEPE